MNSKTISNRLSLVFTKDAYQRIEIEEFNGKLKITVDLHGLSKRNAQKFLTNIINTAINTEFLLFVIHGYHHGTAIKDMIWNTDVQQRISKRIISRRHVYKNDGASFLFIAA